MPLFRRKDKWIVQPTPDELANLFDIGREIQRSWRDIWFSKDRYLTGWHEFLDALNYKMSLLPAEYRPVQPCHSVGVSPEGFDPTDKSCQSCVEKLSCIYGGDRKPYRLRIDRESSLQARAIDRGAGYYRLAKKEQRPRNRDRVMERFPRQMPVPKVYPNPRLSEIQNELPTGPPILYCGRLTAYEKGAQRPVTILAIRVDDAFDYESSRRLISKHVGRELVTHTDVELELERDWGLYKLLDDKGTRVYSSAIGACMSIAHAAAHIRLDYRFMFNPPEPHTDKSQTPEWYDEIKSQAFGGYGFFHLRPQDTGRHEYGLEVRGEGTRWLRRYRGNTSCRACTRLREGIPLEACGTHRSEIDPYAAPPKVGRERGPNKARIQPVDHPEKAA